jgi:Flp pilus assembly protein TadG
MRRLALSSQRGQSLIEFAFLAPVMVLLIAGMIDLGRGFYYQTEMTDAARDTARVLAGEVQASSPPAAPVGPTFTAGCNEAKRDLYNVDGLNITNVACFAGTSTSAPTTAGTANVFIDCGQATDCQTPSTTAQGCGMTSTNTNANSYSTYPSCITVTVVYLFSVLSAQIQTFSGPTIVMTDTAQMDSLW